MAGFDATWSATCVPIERRSIEARTGKREMSVADFCACRTYAERFVGTMTERSSASASSPWDARALTMNFKCRRRSRAFGKFVRGPGLQGQAGHWCIHCRTALASGGQYQDHTSPSIYVEFAHRRQAGWRVPQLVSQAVSVLIWTTTPWTIPSNLSIAFHPGFDYAASTSTAAR
jgi:isoleucyl-tRNA synthetase